MFSYPYIVTCWFVYDVVKPTIDGLIETSTILPFWLTSNFAVGITGYHLGDCPDFRVGSEIAWYMSSYPHETFTPWFTLHRVVYTFGNSNSYISYSLPDDLMDFFDIWWWLIHADNMWWKFYLWFEDEFYYVVYALLTKPNYFFVIWEW